MLTRNSQTSRDAFALSLVKDHGLTLRNLQIALERSAAAKLDLDLVLVELKLLPNAAIAKAAETANFVMTAEQPGQVQAPKDETRAFARHGTNLAVKFQDWENVRIAYANNISRGGLGITLPLSCEAPSVDSVVRLVISLPNGKTLEVRGQVCYRRDSAEHRHLGVQLHHTHTEELLVIDKLVKSLAR